jgi:hypothetical protein
MSAGLTVISFFVFHFFTRLRPLFSDFDAERTVRTDNRPADHLFRHTAQEEMIHTPAAWGSHYNHVRLSRAAFSTISR